MSIAKSYNASLDITDILISTIICCHRTFSDIAFNPLENLSGCVRPAAKHNLPNRLKQTHTTRCLSSIQQQVKLLTLPKQPFCHSPFIICMVVMGTLPYFSACTGLLQGSELVVARNQIRLIIGCLNALGDVWKKGASRAREMKAIGKEVLFGTKPPALEQQQATTAPSSTDSTCESDIASESFLNSDLLLLPIGDNSCAEGIWPLVNGQLDTSFCIVDDFETRLLNNCD